MYTTFLHLRAQLIGLDVAKMCIRYPWYCERVEEEAKPD